MKSLYFEVDIYEWQIEVHFLEKKDKKFRMPGKHTIPKSVKEKFNRDIKRGLVDGGEVLSDTSSRVSVLITTPITNKKERLKLIIHETYHIVSKIKDTLNLDEEACAYLMEYISSKILNSKKLK